MKPSDRIRAECMKIVNEHGASLALNERRQAQAEALPYAILVHLDEEAERCQAFESDVLKRLEKLEAKAAPAEDVGPEVEITVESIVELGRIIDKRAAETKAAIDTQLCRWCRKTEAEHMPPEQVDRPRAKCPCLGWRENFVPAVSAKYEPESEEQ